MPNYINQYKEFLVPEKRVPKNQIKQCNIYRVSTYSGDTKSGSESRYIFVIGRVGDKIHCIKLNEVLPANLIKLIKDVRDKSKQLTKDYKDLASLLKSFDREGKRLFEGYIKRNRGLYSYKLGNYRTYFINKLQYVSLIDFEYEELAKLLNEKVDTKVEINQVLKEDRSEND